MRRFLLCAVLPLSICCGIGTSLHARESSPMVAAASSLRDALPDLVEAFAAEAGTGARMSFGGSGNLQRQIVQGAPFELFLSADDAMVLKLAEENRIRDQGAVYALGRLCVLVPKDSALDLDRGLRELGAAIRGGRLTRISIANPTHAPYGKAAREVLTSSALWEPVEDRLVVGENASQAAQFVATGGADAGLIACSLALSPRLEECCKHAPLPAEAHQPIRQRGVLLKGASSEAERLFAFVLGPQGQAILKRHGFGVPIRD